MDPRTRERLAKLLRMVIGSSHAGERDNAREMIVEILRRHGYSPAEIDQLFATGAADDDDDGQPDTTESGSTQKASGASAIEELVDIATSDGAELYRSPDGVSYADLIVDGHRDRGCWRCRSRCAVGRSPSCAST